MPKLSKALLTEITRKQERGILTCPTGEALQCHEQRFGITGYNQRSEALAMFNQFIVQDLEPQTAIEALLFSASADLPS
jgi:hypothetical protein